MFRALTDEKELTHWFPDQAKLEEPRVDGFMQFMFFEDGKENHRVEGKVLEIVPNKKISYSWANKFDPNFPKTTVTWTLEEVDGNKTRVTLVHAGFDSKSKWYDLSCMAKDGPTLSKTDWSSIAAARTWAKGRKSNKKLYSLTCQVKN